MRRFFMMYRFYRRFTSPSLEGSATLALSRIGMTTDVIGMEYCYYIGTQHELSARDEDVLRWLLTETFEPRYFGPHSFLEGVPTVVEIGPRLNFETAWSSAAVAICHSCGVDAVTRMERSVRFGLAVQLSYEQQAAFSVPLHDRMTQMPHREPLTRFDSGLVALPIRTIPLLSKGMAALKEINRELGLAMDEDDLALYYDLFVNVLKRDPTDAEMFQLGQSNSEHSRHGYFKGKHIIDGNPMPWTLMQIVKAPWVVKPGNSVIAFCDDSSALRGGPIPLFVAAKPGNPSPMTVIERVCHPTLTAETHNFPTGWSPFAGAETGTGGRIRDNQVVGRGGAVIAAGAAYCVGNLHIPGYEMPWEQDGWQHPQELASPLEILIQASNGASDYGNKFGEPVLYGFTRTYGVGESNGEYRSFYKPIMYTVGAGQLDDAHITKGDPESEMLVVQIGGPAYRIGIGGGAASSMSHGENVAELDFNAVQRGDAQMEQRMHRVIRACTELGDDNPIVTIHDLGAGGDCNAVPEIVYPAGAKIKLRAIPVGDKSLSVLEIWGNESQERDVLLIRQESLSLMQSFAEREGVPLAVIGVITGDGKLMLHDELDASEPVDLPLERILGAIPQKTFAHERVEAIRAPLAFPDEVSFPAALELVLRLPSVASKAYLTRKVDRSVTGLVAQQQCVGPNHLTLSDYAVIAQSYFSLAGVALSLGEQPIKGLLSPVAMARLAVAEALLNMAGAKITKLEDIKLSANWMAAPKLKGEGVWLYDAACALRDICMKLGIAIDGGKDSLSMAARALAPDGTRQVVKAPGELVAAFYAPMSDITRKVTPDFKEPHNSIFWIECNPGKARLGGSALAQVYGQLGDECPDVDDVERLKRIFYTVQLLVEQGLVHAVHDVSDGGLIVALLEMAFAGNVGLDVKVQTLTDTHRLETFFSEEPGLLVEVKDIRQFTKLCRARDVNPHFIGTVGEPGGLITVAQNDRRLLLSPMAVLREAWEETSSKLDALQANPACVAEETKIRKRLVTPPPYIVSFEPKPTLDKVLHADTKPLVAVLREQGTNGDREMAAAFYSAGFEVWDVTMSDLLAGRMSLDRFRGVVFPGGFANADVMDSGKGWAGMIRFNPRIAEEFGTFYKRSDTFSLGVCNGCQLMALLGWVSSRELTDEMKPRFIRNESERFESRFPSVRIPGSNAMLFQGMEGSVLGVWVAHGEGRLRSDPTLLAGLAKNGQVCLEYVDQNGEPTMQYPFNPSGTFAGIAGLCSKDGRHLAIMPHPERVFLKWQWPWIPQSWHQGLEASPWLRMFQNAYSWCTRT